MSARDSSLRDETLQLWRLFIVGRSVVTGAFAVALFVINGLTVPESLTSVFMLAGLQFLTNGFYFYLWKQRDIFFLGCLCFTLEIILITLLILAFGSDGYMFALAYLWPIIMGGWLLGTKALLLLTLLSSVAYALVFGLIQRGVSFTADGAPSDLTIQVFVLSISYLVFVALSGWLLTHEVERGEKRLRSRNLRLRQLNAELHGILTNMAEAVVVVDGETVRLSNDAARELLGVKQDGRLPEWFRRQLTEEPQARREQEFQLLEHAGRTISVSTAELDAGDGASGRRVHVARDVTEEARVDQMKTEFLSYVSHELRTPLTTIKMMLPLLLMDISRDAKAYEYLQVIESQVERQRRLVDDLLDLGRLESGQYHIPLEPIDPRQVVDAVFQSCEPLARDKGIALHVSCGDLPDHCLSNSSALEQVLINLVTNGIKFTEPGGQVTIACRRRDDELVLAVEDTGVGMTPEEQSRVMLKFYPAYAPQKRGEGTGLGLVISNMIVQELGGSIEIGSTKGVGSCFTVRLPLSSGAALEPEEPLAASA